MQIISPTDESSLDRRAPMFIDHEVIRITKNGTWLSDGQEIGHDQTLRAFKQNLNKDESGYFVKIGNNFKRIEVEDCAYFVEIAFRDPVDGQIHLRVSDETEILFNVADLQYKPGRLTTRIHAGNDVARFLPQPYHWTLLQLEEGALKELESRA